MTSTAGIPIMNFMTWMLSSLFYAFQMTLRVIPVLMINYFVKKFSLDATQLGLIAGIYYIGYCLAHIPIGLMLDRFQPKYILSFCILICTAGIYCTESTESLFTILVGRFLIGAGSAAGILGAVKVMNDFYYKRYSLMLGFTILIGVCGSYYGATPINNMLLSLSYEQAIQGLVLFGLMLASSIIAFYTNKPSPISDIVEIPAINIITTIISNKKLLLIGLYSGLMVGPIEGFADLWGRNYLIHIHGITAAEATYSVGLILVGLGVGCPIVGYLYSRLLEPSKIVIYIGIAMLTTLSSLLQFSHLPLFCTYIICFLIGFLSSYQIISFSLVSNITSLKTATIATAVLNMIIMFFGFIYHSIIGFILDTFFISSSFDDLVYSQDAYQIAFSPILIGIAIGTYGFYRLK